MLQNHRYKTLIVTRKINLNTVHDDYQSLREKQQSSHIATINADGMPEASYAPFVWRQNACYLFLSQLASHTQNLNINSVISVLIIEDEAVCKNQFARKRIIWRGRAETIARNCDEYLETLSAFKHRFGDFIDLIEPLEDFQLFSVKPESGRFIRGFGQAFQLSGDDLSVITHINPTKK